MLTDKKGERFSKSENGVDPIDMINKFGCDSSWLIVGVGPGNDSRFDEQKLKVIKILPIKSGTLPSFRIRTHF